MARTTIAWDDGSGDNIYLDYSSASGDQPVAVSSDANAGPARSKVVTFSASGITPVALTVAQEAGGGGGGLPAGALPCDLIYTDGYSAFIESGFTPGPSMSYEVDLYAAAITTNQVFSPFGYIISSRRYSPIMWEQGKPEVGFDGWYYLSQTAFPDCVRLRAKVVITQTGISIDYYRPNGTLYTSLSGSYSETDYSPNQTLPLLGRKDSANGIQNGSWRGGLGRLKCYGDDHYGTLVADFIPCYYQGSFGFWEAVSESFKTASRNIFGTGPTWGTTGFFPNTRNVNNSPSTEFLGDWRGAITSAMYEIPSGCTQIRFNAGTVDSQGSLRPLMFFYSDKTYRDYFYYNSEDRVVTVPSNSAYVRLAMTQSLMDTCYIYDVTHGQYIWKGINV